MGRGGEGEGGLGERDARIHQPAGVAEQVAEGADQAEWFMAGHPNALRLDAPGQILPGHLHDGFYYALFKKNGP